MPADLEWRPATGYGLPVTAAEQVLLRDEEAYAAFLEMLRNSDARWSGSRKGVVKN